MRVEAKTNCPLAGFAPCRQLDCAWFIQLRGTSPNSGEEIDEWGCAVSWLPVLLVENAQMGRQTGAAVESFRNELVALSQAPAYSLPILAATGSAGCKAV
jgi:hypothetical protein